MATSSDRLREDNGDIYSKRVISELQQIHGKKREIICYENQKVPKEILKTNSILKNFYLNTSVRYFSPSDLTWVMMCNAVEYKGNGHFQTLLLQAF